MSTGAPNEAIHPYELGGRGAELKARIAISSFERLASLLLSDVGDIAMSARFALDEHRHCIVTGRASGSVRVHCQGCAQDMPYELACELRTTLVRTEEEAKALMPAADVLVVPDDALTLVELLEDELILNLPDVVCGRFDSCPNRPRLNYGDAGEDVAGSSPFSGLADLLKQGNRDGPKRRD